MVNKVEDVIFAVSITHWVAWWQVACSSIVLWDHVATFDQEVEFIWGKKWSFTTLLYFVTRYVGDVIFIHGAMSVLATGSFLDKMCPSVLQVQSWMTQIAVLTMNGIVVKRVVCMYGGDKRVFWTLSIALTALTLHSFSLMILTMNIKSVVQRIHSVNLYEVCHVLPAQDIPSWYWTFVIPMFTLDALTIGLSLRQGILFACENRERQHNGRKVGRLGHLWRTRRALASVLIRDSILFPFINLIVEILVALTWTARLPPGSAECIMVGATVAVPTLGCRLLLNLRGAYYGPFREEYFQSQRQDESLHLPNWSLPTTNNQSESEHH